MDSTTLGRDIAKQSSRDREVVVGGLRRDREERCENLMACVCAVTRRAEVCNWR